MKLIVICAWCGQFIRLKDYPGKIPPKNPITHGICAKCKRVLEIENAEAEAENAKSICQKGGGQHDTQYQ